MQTHLRALVAATIDERPEAPAGITHQHHGLAPDGDGEVIVRSRQLRSMPGKHPAALEEVAHFEIEDRGIAVGVAVDAEGAAGAGGGLVVDQTVEHGSICHNGLKLPLPRPSETWRGSPA